VPDDHNITPVEPFQLSSRCANELGDAESASIPISGLQPGEGVSAHRGSALGPHGPCFLVPHYPVPSPSYLASHRGPIRNSSWYSSSSQGLS
jgi:hypothetical protein